MIRNNIVKQLIEEGFSEKTLANMGDKQVSLLYDRIVGEQISQSQKGVLDMKKGTPPSEIKKVTDTGVNVKLTDEMREESELTMKTSEIAEEEKWYDKFKKNPKKTTDKKSTKKGKFVPFKKKGEQEVEEEGDVDEAARTLANQNRKGSLDGMKYKAGRPKFAHQQEEGKAPGKSAVLAKNDVERKEIKEWVEKLVENDYHSITTKNEIMELIQIKLQEQAPATAPPKTRPKVNPDTRPTPETPKQNPNERPFIDPWKEPGPGPDDDPKFQSDDNDFGDNELPEFLKFSEILNAGNNSLNESRIEKISSAILDKLKKSAKKVSGNGK